MEAPVFLGRTLLERSRIVSINAAASINIADSESIKQPLRPGQPWLASTTELNSPLNYEILPYLFLLAPRYINEPSVLPSS